VQFHFSQTVKAVRPELGGRVAIELDESTLMVDGVVLAAGMQNVPLLKPLGMTPPLCAVQSYNAMVAVKNRDEAPNTVLFDETYKVAIARVGNRIRVSGLHGWSAAVGSAKLLADAISSRTSEIDSDGLLLTAAAI